MEVDAALRERYESVAALIDDAARAASRSSDELSLIVVTKFQPASLVRQLHSLGVRHIGENRHQDAEPKARELADLPLEWHFVGQLQSNKARAVTQYCRVVHSLDRSSLLRALDRAETTVGVFLEVNLTDDPGRGGADPAALPGLAERVLASPRLALRGVMAVAPRDEEPRRAFARLREHSDVVRGIAPEAGEISAGMSGDFAEAIAEGATHLRIGTAITGNRPADR
ncbi:MAG: YggS family pyridoxal phosphate-dependent enzyme [Microcella sp.]|uniref:YggS family pyridoxal phosphate-dependent enzyme n=1 Tax=Microcella sp. TaxID=1913979 RepID=UPI00331647DE